MDIDVTIDRLVLDGLGVDSRTAALIGASIETELARRLTGDAGNAADRAVERLLANAAVPALRPAPVAMPGGSGAQAMGRSIAGAVMGGLGHA